MRSREQDLGVKGEVRSWVEEDRGVVGLVGEIDLPMGVQISLAASEHVADRTIARVVFDFEYAVFLHSGLLSVLNTTHGLTMRAGLKEMSLRRITSSDIRKLLEVSTLDQRFVIEEEDEADGAVSYKAKFSTFKPAGH